MTTIYYTEGPVAQDLGAQPLIEAGARGARLSFSFGTPELQRERAIKVKNAAAKLGVQVTVMADLEGDKPRMGMLKTPEGNDFYEVELGEKVHVVWGKEVEMVAGGPKLAPIGEKDFYDALNAGVVLVIGDANVLLKMDERKGDHVVATVVGAGKIQSRRGINVQKAMLCPSCLTEKDREALRKIAQWDEIDEVAISFVSKAADMEDARAEMRKTGTVKKVCAKVETPAGIANIREIAKSADAVMIARGDLALTLPWTDMPAAVLAIAEACNAEGCPWFLATQIAEGMDMFNMMTRAEMCDLDRWLRMGAGGLVLSRETAFGKQPVETIKAVSEMVQARAEDSAKAAA
jgi:pyruvate kinase